MTDTIKAIVKGCAQNVIIIMKGTKKENRVLAKKRILSGLRDAKTVGVKTRRSWKLLSH